jgi:hypothetical protein
MTNQNALADFAVMDDMAGRQGGAGAEYATCDGHTWWLDDIAAFELEGEQQTGRIEAFRRNVANGAMCAWIELDGDLPGLFAAVPVQGLTYPAVKS